VGEGFLSYYDETKFQSHRAVEERIGAGAPIVIAMPGMTYGPRDHSGVGLQLKGAHDGTLAYRAMGELGISAVHVDDVASGIVAALDRGRLGETYVLGGPNLRLVDAMQIAARVGGKRLPPALPMAMVRLGSHAPAALARLAGMPDDLREVLRASHDVTYWASSAKAAGELGYAPRDLASGVRAAFDGD
jgi:nucleoside-diphosphate-sugar epimerase